MKLFAICVISLREVYFLQDLWFRWVIYYKIYLWIIIYNINEIDFCNHISIPLDALVYPQPASFNDCPGKIASLSPSNGKQSGRTESGSLVIIHR